MRRISIAAISLISLVLVACKDQADTVRNSIGQAKSVKSEVEDITAKRMDEANKLLSDEVKRADEDEDTKK